MKTNLFLYLSAGFNVGALSSVLLRMSNSGPSLPSRKEVATIVLSGLAAVSTIGYALLNKSEVEMTEDDSIDVHENSARRLEAFLV
jgi:hypothetical protein